MTDNTQERVRDAANSAMVDTGDAHDCLAKFKSNRNFGLIVLAGVVAGQVAG